MKLYHNPRCGKSRDAKNYLVDNNIPHETVLYLKEGVSKEEILSILNSLNETPDKLVRTNEVLFKEKYSKTELNKENVIKMISENPILLERPILLKDQKAAIGRPLENIKNII